jgi:tetratricopeptide (TPR) repeat protein
MLILILRSDSRQGLVAFSIGAGFVVVYAIFCQNKVFGFISVAIFILVFIFAILGMLQTGPLTSLLYKDSVSVRGFYWRAGIEMFLNQPIHGIGLDRFGAYFKEMRELQYPLNYGFNLTSTNAHNVYIQLFATGGLLVGLPYLALKIAIAVLGMKHLFISSKNNFAFVGLFAGWLAFEAQSIISIDNIGLSVWGWILGGAILGISVNKPSSGQGNKIPKSLQEPSIRMLFAAIIFISTSIFGLFFLKGESEMWKTRSIFDSNQSTSNEAIKNRIFGTLSVDMIDPVWKIMLVDYLAQSGYLDEAEREIDLLLDTDKRNLDALLVKSRIHAASKDTLGTIETQLEISKYDPQNAENYLQLLRNYMFVNNLEMAQKMKLRIYEISPESEQAKLAEKELIKEVN